MGHSPCSLRCTLAASPLAVLFSFFVTLPCSQPAWRMRLRSPQKNKKQTKCGVGLSLHIVLERVADSGHLGQLGPRGNRWADKPFGDVAAGNLCPEVSRRAQSGRVGADFWFSGRHIPPHPRQQSSFCMGGTPVRLCDRILGSALALVPTQTPEILASDVFPRSLQGWPECVCACVSRSLDVLSDCAILPRNNSAPPLPPGSQEWCASAATSQ